MTSALAPTQGKPCRRTVGLPSVIDLVSISLLLARIPRQPEPCAPRGRGPERQDRGAPRLLGPARPAETAGPCAKRAGDAGGVTSFRTVRCLRLLVLTWDVARFAPHAGPAATRLEPIALDLRSRVAERGVDSRWSTRSSPARCKMCTSVYVTPLYVGADGVTHERLLSPEDGHSPPLAERPRNLPRPRGTVRRPREIGRAHV